MSNKNFFILCILSVGLYYVSLWTGNFVRKTRKRNEVKPKPTQDYVNKVIKSINKMNGSQFEDFVEFLFRDMGYNVRQTKKTKDGGKDLILKTKKGKVYVEIKRYASKNLVSSPLVLKLIGSATSDGVRECIFITTSGYTNDAIDLADNSKVSVKLVDTNGVVDIIKQCNPKKVLGYLGY